MFDHPADPYLVIAIVVLTIWQLWTFAASVAMVRSAKYGKVRVGIAPGLIAAVLAVLVVWL